MTNNNAEKIWCVVPAAGIGSRMLTDCPKQYLPFQSSTVLDTTISRLLASQQIEKLVVCLREADNYWPKSAYASHNKVIVAAGGEQRADSVLNGILAFKEHAGPDDWVLVHDAVRPCVKTSDIEFLIQRALEIQQGAILAAPIHDTIKQVNNDVSVNTVDRSHLWRALTPQLFKLLDLEQALLTARANNVQVTDEASAIEQFDKPVHIVEGSTDNIKITSPGDLSLAGFYMQQQEVNS
ncbi:MAG: 2-C-methyl-D-erythritol 4-phosphate cytidylyltransferase [Cycloclasticus sp.]|nr:MAG: 2-C-methyl-D-erythritol 4-phosphate cytidylyltransferase [Cycloclasticus sp.]